MFKGFFQSFFLWSEFFPVLFRNFGKELESIEISGSIGTKLVEVQNFVIC